jgi:hypothetical protein
MNRLPGKSLLNLLLFVAVCGVAGCGPSSDVIVDGPGPTQIGETDSSLVARGLSAALNGGAQPGGVELIGEWSGTGTQVTPLFSAKPGWGVCFQGVSTASEFMKGTISVAIYGPDGELIEMIDGDAGDSMQKSTSYVHRGGPFYLKILAANCSWKVVAVGEKPSP